MKIVVNSLFLGWISLGISHLFHPCPKMNWNLCKILQNCNLKIISMDICYVLFQILSQKIQMTFWNVINVQMWILWIQNLSYIYHILIVLSIFGKFLEEPSENCGNLFIFKLDFIRNFAFISSLSKNELKLVWNITKL